MRNLTAKDLKKISRLVPIGTILAWHKNIPGTHLLKLESERCNPISTLIY